MARVKKSLYTALLTCEHLFTMSKELGYKQVKNVESRRTWDRDYYEAKVKERLAKGDDCQEKEDAPSRRSNKEEFQPAAPGAAGPAGSARAYLKVTFFFLKRALMVHVQHCTRTRYSVRGTEYFRGHEREQIKS